MNLINYSSHQFLQAILAICVGYFAGLVQSAQAVQLADGTIYFAYPPSLLEARTTQKAIRAASTYYFTLDLPANAGSPLERVVFTEQEGRDDIKFELNKTRAFSSQPSKPQILINQMTLLQKTRMVSVTFTPPISPGQTVTVALHPCHNPALTGIYLFGVKAFPQGEKAHGQFLGFGRLYFY